MTATLPDVELEYQTEPRDLHALRPWLNVIRRLRSAALDSGSYCAIKIVVITDCNGKPMKWTAPKVTTIEPRADSHVLDALLYMLGE